MSRCGIRGHAAEVGVFGAVDGLYQQPSLNQNAVDIVTPCPVHRVENHAHTGLADRVEIDLCTDHIKVIRHGVDLLDQTGTHGLIERHIAVTNFAEHGIGQALYFCGDFWQSRTTPGG